MVSKCWRRCRLLTQLAVAPSLYQLGTTKVFFRQQALEALERRRQRVLLILARRIQAAARGRQQRRRWAELKRAVALIARVERGAAGRRKFTYTKLRACA